METTAVPTAPLNPETPAVAPRHAEEPTTTAPEPEAAPGRTVEDVITACDDFTALEWLNVRKYLDVATHEVQGDAVVAAIAVCAVEDRRESGLWRFDKFHALTATELYAHLGVDTDTVKGTPTEAVAEATKSTT